MPAGDRRSGPVWSKLRVDTGSSCQVHLANYSPGQRNEAQIQTETSLQDFGLLITLENEPMTPTGEVVGTIIR